LSNRCEQRGKTERSGRAEDGAVAGALSENGALKHSENMGFTRKHDDTTEVSTGKK